MKYLKLFDTNSDYLSYREGGGYIKPNVSLSIDTEEVHYNYPKWNTNNKPFVDLDLPSGTLWATMNVGADKPSDYGLYFQWGDTVGYTAEQVGTDKQFNWANYKWNPSGDGSTFTKYVATGATLELEDDAVHVNMGGDWHIPSPTQIKELLDNTTTAWTTSDGVSGMTFTSEKDTSKFIFIPAGGDALDGLVSGSGRYGSIWLSMLTTDDAIFSQRSSFYSDSVEQGGYLRYIGCSVRGVIG